MTYILAIDYGSSFTTAALRKNGRGELLAFGGSEAQQFRLPSIVWVDEDGALVTGWAAERGAALAPERLERSPKRYLGDEEPLQLGRPVWAQEAAAAVLARVLEEAGRREGAPPSEVALTHPASWPNKRKAALHEAARQAGLCGVQLVPEPVAAAHYLAGIDLEPDKPVAVYDLGGGTFDTAVLRRRANADFETLSVGGQDGLGGEVFDARLARHIGQTLNESDPEDWAALERSPRSLAALRSGARAAKEDLSFQGAADVILPEASRRTSLRLTREELERLIEPDVRRSAEILQETVAAAGLALEDLGAVFLAGGTSRIPLVGRVLSETFARVPETREDPKAVVVLGAAERTKLSEPGVEAPEEPESTPPDDRAGGAAGPEKPQRPERPDVPRPQTRSRFTLGRPALILGTLLALTLGGAALVGILQPDPPPPRPPLRPPEEPELSPPPEQVTSSIYPGSYEECIDDGSTTSAQCQPLPGGRTNGMTYDECLADTDTSREECEWLPGGADYPGNYDDCVSDRHTTIPQCSALLSDP